MSNSYYTAPGTPAPFTRARAEEVSEAFTAVEAAFDLLPSPEGLADLSAAIGSVGPNNLRATIATLKASNPEAGTLVLGGAFWDWVPKNFAGQADDVTVVQGNGIALTAGAWKRRPAPFTAPAVVTPSDNLAALQALLNSSPIGAIQLDGRTYDIGAGTLGWFQSNIVVRGVPGATKITTTAPALLYFLSCHDVVIEDIIFECTGSIPGDDYRGLVCMFNEAIRRITFKRCTFTAPNAAINALKLIAESGTAFLESIHCEDCVIDGVGRMGLEVQNHPTPDDTVKRYRDIRWSGGRIANTGLVSNQSNGQGVSFSGYGSECVVDTLFDNNLLACVENVGCTSLTVSGATRNITRPCDVLSYTGGRVMPGCVIDNFMTLDQANGSALIRNTPGLKSDGLMLNLKGGVALKNVSDARFTNYLFKCAGGNALFVEGLSAEGGTRRNQFLGGRIDASTGTATFATVRFYGDGVNANTVESSEIVQGPTGVMADEQNGAARNLFRGRLTMGAPAPAAKTIIAFPADDNATISGTYAVLDWEAGAQTLVSGVPLTGTRIFTMPAGIPGLHVIRNATSGGQSITIAQVGGGATVTIPADEARTLYFDANGVHQA